MSKRFHHYLIFNDPTGNQLPHPFCDELLKPYGSTRLPALFHNDIFADDDPDGNGDIDERKFRHILAKGDNNGRIPQNSWCWLDIENIVHNTYKHIQEPPWTVPQQEGIDFFHRVLDVAKDERDDVKWGLYGQVPAAPYILTLSERHEEARERLYSANRSLARELGFLLPYFYDNKVRPDSYNTLEHRLQWITTTLRAARYHYPGKPLIGMTWMAYHDLWRERPDPDTHEHQVLRSLTGYEWRKFNETILELTDGVLWWGQSGDWDEGAEWWQMSKELFVEFGATDAG